MFQSKVEKMKHPFYAHYTFSGTCRSIRGSNISECARIIMLMRAFSNSLHQILSQLFQIQDCCCFDSVRMILSGDNYWSVIMGVDQKFFDIRRISHKVPTLKEPGNY
jgi:hypothetical protein